jgi:hypothetical protein
MLAAAGRGLCLSGRPAEGLQSRVWSQSGRRMTDARPFEAWVEFARTADPDRLEDIVVFFAVIRDGDVLTSALDISTGEGVILVDGPTHTVIVDSEGAWQAGILAHVADTERFLNESYGLLREALC